MQEKVGSKRFSKEKRGDREKNERDEGLGQRCGGRCPYLNRKTLKKRNKRNVFYMIEKCGSISGYMFCFFMEAGWKIKKLI